jgi:hypothetical protein
VLARGDDQLSAEDRACAEKPANDHGQRDDRGTRTCDVREVRASRQPPDKDSRDSNHDGDSHSQWHPNSAKDPTSQVGHTEESGKHQQT